MLSIPFFVSDNLSDICDDKISDLSHLDTAVEIKSLLNYEFTSGHSNILSVRGRLALCYDEWVNLGASGFILRVVRDGYKIPFVSLLPPKVSSNNGSALKDSHFVSEAISDSVLRTKASVLRFWIISLASPIRFPFLFNLRARKD